MLDLCLRMQRLARLASRDTVSSPFVYGGNARGMLGNQQHGSRQMHKDHGGKTCSEPRRHLDGRQMGKDADIVDMDRNIEGTRRISRRWQAFCRQENTFAMRALEGVRSLTQGEADRCRIRRIMARCT